MYIILRIIRLCLSLPHSLYSKPLLLLFFLSMLTCLHGASPVLSLSSPLLSQPQNILLTSDAPLGDIKIVDFGLSRMVSSHQELREIMGTPEYVGERTD